jgi:hypothetical protein
MESENIILSVANEIQEEAKELKQEAKNMRTKHQFFTVATILLGVSAPAFVTYTPAHIDEVVWKLAAIVITALASASATIRAVLRYGDRYANASLTSMALEDLYAELDAKRNEVMIQVRQEYIPVKLAEYSSWGRKEMYTIKKAYMEKEVAATTKDKIELQSAPVIHATEKIDHTKKSPEPVMQIKTN